MGQVVQKFILWEFFLLVFDRKPERHNCQVLLVNLQLDVTATLNRQLLAQRKAKPNCAMLDLVKVLLGL